MTFRTDINCGTNFWLNAGLSDSQVRRRHEDNRAIEQVIGHACRVSSKYFRSSDHYTAILSPDIDN